MKPTMTSPTAPSGEQLELVHRDRQAVVVEVGGGLRTLAVGGREVLDGYAVDELCTSGRGQVLMPWPNRIEDGRYEFDGRRHQLPLTEPGEGNAALRFRAMAAMVEAHGAVVFVDCDDLMHPGRVDAARRALDSADVVACALRLVDAAGEPLGITFEPRAPADAAAMLPRCNVFGLSNTAWQADALRRCLPGPASCELVDWHLATRAWLDGATLCFDPAVHMDYRRHGANLAPVEGPFSPDGVRRATGLVARHHELLAPAVAAAAGPRALALQEARHSVSVFEARVVDRAPVLEEYVRQLNALQPDRVWWWMVANPALEALWSN